jgi:ankyrin repeat protein
MKKTSTMKADELFYLLSRNRLSEFKSLLEGEEKYDINCKNNKGESLLMVAIEKFQLEAIHYLVNSSINFELTNTLKHTAFHYTIYKYYHTHDDLENIEYLEKCLTCANLILDKSLSKNIELKPEYVIDSIKNKVESLVHSYEERQAILNAMSSQQYFDIKNEKKIVKKAKI